MNSEYQNTVGLDLAFCAKSRLLLLVTNCNKLKQPKASNMSTPAIIHIDGWACDMTDNVWRH